jgi:DNA helicase II / ATP-dependent DNA helicase PcrA
MNAFQSTDAILDSLNPAQREAVTTIQGPLMTLAGPGSGKTRVVTHRIAHMISQGIPSHAILAMTFTNKAAQAIRERIRRMVGDQPVTMGTFHGFGARFLRRYGRSVGLEENFSILDADDSKKALEEAVLEAKVALTHVSIADIAREISRLKTKLVTPESLDQIELGRLNKIIRDVYPAYQKKLLDCRAVDFDDLLMHTATVLRTEPELRADLDRRYEYILVDEYQDTNFAQYVIVRALSIDYPNINVTGDPDQSVYSWRGANIENIFSFERDFPMTKVVRLEENYRSTPEILSLADALIQNNKRRKAKNLVAVRESGPRVRLVHYRDDEDEAESIADQIKTSIVDRGAKARDFAVLYRTNAQSRLFEKALIKRRLNYQLIGGFRFYQRQEIKDLLCYLRLVHNPRDDVAFDRIINTPTRGLGQKTLEKVADLAREDGISRLEALARSIDHGILSKKAAASAEVFLKVYSQLLEMATGQIVPLLNFLLEATDYLAYLAKQKSADEDDKFDSNVTELLADAKQVDEQFEDGNGLENFLEQVSLLSETDNLGEDADRVTLMTLHASKGLEFPNVFVVAVEQDILPHARCREQPEQVEEERRLLFVGITRAEDRLQLSTAAKRGFAHRSSIPSQFLMEIPRLELEITDNQHDYDDCLNDPDYDGENRSHRKSFRSKSSRFGDEWDSDKEFQIPADTDKKPGEITITFDPENTVAQTKKKKPTDAPAELSQLLGRLKSGASLAPVATTTGCDVRLFREGVQVTHPTLGTGQVVSIDGHGAKRRATVKFQGTDEKTFVLSCSPLQVG